MCSNGATVQLAAHTRLCHSSGPSHCSWRTDCDIWCCSEVYSTKVTVKLSLLWSEAMEQ